MGDASNPSNGRITRRLATLSAAAILSVYAVGYVRTQAATPSTGQPPQPITPNDAANTTGSSPANTGSSNSAPTGPIARRGFDDDGFPRGGQTTQPAAPVVTATPSTPSTSSSGTSSTSYRDGTYVGSGTSRHGGIEATVVVSHGKISSVSITQCLTRYSCSWIASLPGQVVQRQSARVDLVSGASDSSRAFAMAVSNALSHAA